MEKLNDYSVVSFEVTLRFLCFQKKRHCLGDAWFVFDFCLVTMMVVETWVMPIALGGSEMPLAKFLGTPNQD